MNIQNIPQLLGENEKIAEKIGDLILERILKKIYKKLNKQNKKKMEEIFTSGTSQEKDAFIEKYLPDFENDFLKELNGLMREVKKEALKKK